MAAGLELWAHAASYGEGRHGGWAYVERSAEGLRGMAGGERGAASVERMTLAALVHALTVGEPRQAPVTIHAGPLTAQAAASLPDWKAAGWRTAAGETVPDRDLWERLHALLQARPGSRFVPASGGPFVAAWADFALGKVKTAGPFAAAIPKPNLKGFG